MKLRVSVCAVALWAVAGSAMAGLVDLNGGSSWAGWDSRGNSLDVGIWGAQSTTRNFELYTTSFTSDGSMSFDSSTGGVQVKTGGAPSGFAAGGFSTGAFAAGNTIYGIGLKMKDNSRAVGTSFISFDLSGNNFQAASALGAADGRVDLSTWGKTGDFSIWMDGVSGNGPSNLGVLKTDGTAHAGTGAITNLVGGIGSGVSYDFAFRQFRNGDVNGSVQYIFDLSTMQDLYKSTGANYITSGWNNGLGSIGGTGNNFKISLYNSNPGFGNGSQVTFKSDPVAVVPLPSSVWMGLTLLAGIAGLSLLNKYRQRPAAA
jgi:hypothetical protein